MDRVVIVTKATRLKELTLLHLTEGAAQFSLESRGQSIEPYRQEHHAYMRSLSIVQAEIPNDLPVATVSRERLPNFLFRDNDLIVVCGPDGLFVNAAKYIGAQPVLTVNPDPNTIAGVLMLFKPNEVGSVINAVGKEKHKIERLPFVKATIDDDRVIWGVNDLFIGRKDHVSARYELSFQGRTEPQSSSGIIVSTGIGSTGWLRSVAAMVEGLTDNRLPHKLKSMPSPTSEELVFVVREPFKTPSTGVDVVTGRIVPGRPLQVTSQMPDGGYVFSDGIVEKAIEWKAGSILSVSVGDRYVQRIVR